MNTELIKIIASLFDTSNKKLHWTNLLLKNHLNGLSGLFLLTNEFYVEEFIKAGSVYEH